MSKAAARLEIPLRGWTAAAPDGSRAAVTESADGARLDFELGGPGAWAIARRTLPLGLPPHWVTVLEIAGEAPPCELQVKLIDPSGANVWWWRLPATVLKPAGARIVLRRASLGFAWGPAGGGMPDQLGAIEIAVASDQPIAGWLRVASLAIEPRALSVALPQPVAVAASSCVPGHEPVHATDPDAPSTFEPDALDPNPWLELDFGGDCEFGGLVVDWSELPGPACRLLGSDDGANWTLLAQSGGTSMTRTWLRTAEGDGRYARIEFAGGVCVGVESVRAVPIEAAVAPARWAESLALGQPRGSYPRHLSREAGVWAVVGGDGDTQKGLLGEDGPLEVGAEGFTIEPVLRCDGRIFTWADAETSASLEAGHCPIPSVGWTVPGLSLRVTAFAAGAPGESALVGRYEVTNTGTRACTPQLVLAIRPYQVLPVWQSLNIQGGVAPITHLEFLDDVVRVNGTRDVALVTRPDAFAALRSEHEPVACVLAKGELPDCTRVDDPLGLIEAALVYDLALGAGESATIAVAVPLHAATPPPPAGRDRATAAAWVDARHAEAVAFWRTRLGAVPIELPPCAAAFSDTLRASIAWVFVNGEGPRIQPGPRSYRRSWIRDGTLTGTALAEMGFAGEARDFLRWYAPFQYEDGRVPCAVDRNDVVDRAIEHDSHGQLVWGVVEVFRLTRDRDFLAELWPHAARAAEAIIALRAQRTTDAYRGDPRFGMLPESISHEGYASHPVHSYWDDFFAVRGLADAAEAAAVLGDAANQRRFAAERDAMRRDLRASIEGTIAQHGIDFVPGSVELGDFDPSSTAIALDPCGARDLLPDAALHRTFDRYWAEFEARRRGEQQNDAYTAYEIRNAGALAMLGEERRAQQLLEFLIADQRSVAWRQWPEISLREPRLARFIGDIPHGWIASSFVRALRRLLVFERAEDGALVIAAGIPEAWLRDGDGVRVTGLPTHCGPLHYAIRAQDDVTVVVRFGEGLDVPPGGLVVASPGARVLRAVEADGRAHTDFDAAEVRLRRVPAELILRY